MNMAETPSQARLGIRVFMAATVILCQSIQSLATGGISIFLPLIRHDVSLTYAQAGTLGSASTLTYAFMQIPAGYLSDRIGPKRIFIAGTFGTAVLALSFGRLDAYNLMIINQLVTGVFRALMFAPGLLLIVSIFPPERRTTAMGLYVAGGVSTNVFITALGPILVGPLGWRNLFFIFAGAGLAVMILYWLFGPSGPGSNVAHRASLREMFALSRSRVMLLIGGIQYVRLAVNTGLRYWLPTYIVLKGYPLEVAGLVVAVQSFVTAPANFFGGYFSDRFRSPFLIIGASQALLTVTTFLYVHVSSLPALLAVAAVNGLVVQLYFGPLFALPLQLMGERAAGVTTGIGNFWANLGGLTFAFTIGVIKQVTGSFAIGFYCLTGCCVVAMGFTIALWRIARRMEPASRADPGQARAEKA